MGSRSRSNRSHVIRSLSADGTKRRSRRSRKDSKKHSRSVHNNGANSGMSLTELQKMAKSMGIPFGGLTKGRLARKINKYA